MPQADTCISKIFSVLQDLKIAMKLINTASIQQHLTWWGGAWERKNICWHYYIVTLRQTGIHRTFLLNWHWYTECGSSFEAAKSLYVDFCFTGLTRFLPHCTLITWRHAKRNQPGSWKVICLISNYLSFKSLSDLGWKL